VTPQWPDAEGKRVFVYLKPFENLPDLLDILQRLRLPTVAHVEQAPAAIVQRFTGPAMRFEAQPVDMGIAARECDVAILNGTHASTITMLLAGKPALHLPTYVEQGMCAAAVKRLGAGLSAPHNQPHRIEGELRALLASDEFAAAAAAFAHRYAGFDTRAHWCQLVDRLESLAGDTPDRAARQQPL
jgi:UDP:flavonoid glycosyltransferase YjiC (YdhE family)